MTTRQDTVELFRKRLNEIIERAGLSRSAFARKCGIDRSTLAQILSPETDRLPRVETLWAIASSEQTSVDWLIGLSQEGRLDTNILHQSVQIERGGRAPSDEHLARWHAEAVGYKIRHIPTTLPDLLKTPEVIEHEYRSSALTTPQQRQEISVERLAYQRRPETDMEICTPMQSLELFAYGQGIWKGLSKVSRKTQLQRFAELAMELYPTFRWFMYDGRQRFSVPLTVFGPKRVVIYVGQMYFSFNSKLHIEVLTNSFDDIIRSAVVQPTELSTFLTRLIDDI